MTRSSDSYVSLDDRNIKGDALSVYITIHSNLLKLMERQFIGLKQPRGTCRNIKYVHTKESLTDK